MPRVCCTTSLTRSVNPDVHGAQSLGMNSPVVIRQCSTRPDQEVSNTHCNLFNLAAEIGLIAVPFDRVSDLFYT
jgi:hypothetical protein